MKFYLSFSCPSVLWWWIAWCCYLCIFSWEVHLVIWSIMTSLFNISRVYLFLCLVDWNRRVCFLLLKCKIMNYSQTSYCLYLRICRVFKYILFIVTAYSDLFPDFVKEGINLFLSSVYVMTFYNFWCLYVCWKGLGVTVIRTLFRVHKWKDCPQDLILRSHKAATL